ncbi:ABC transporter ATP-binding protein [Streptosporangium sp. NPDC051023]|uniref:ABC transporter ATP-binding protein n=1 Tax=Streptosporangium sp. NPDC051023 TaxID=3155410 RepID=UPI00344B5369
MPAVELVGITKRFGDVVANDGIDLSVEAGEIHAVVGENGAGKSTLMSVMYGMHQPDAGHVLRDGVRLRMRSPADAIAGGLGMVHQRFRLFPELTVTENVVIGAEPTRRGVLDTVAARREVERLGELYGLRADPVARVGTLPVGVRQRVEILKALYRDARVLILDEPTAVLTPGEAAQLFEVLRTVTGNGASVVLVTHKLGEVLAASDRVTVLRHGRVTGRFTTAETTAEELVVAMIGRSLAPGPRHTPPRGHEARHTSPHDREARHSSPNGPGSPPPHGDGPTAREPDAPGVTREPYLLEVENLRVLGGEGPAPVDGVSFGVRRGEIVGIAGVAGSGQRELLDIVTGLRAPDEGRVLLAGHPVRRGRDPRVAYVPEDRHGRATAPTMSLADNLLMGEQRGSRFSRAAVRERARTLVKRFGIRTASVDEPISGLSGGNAQKAVLARELSRGRPLIVVEEPTQGVDVGAQERIHALLAEARDEGGAVLLQSSELPELRALADRILVMFEGRIVAELPSDEASDARLGAAMTGAAAGDATADTEGNTEGDTG